MCWINTRAWSLGLLALWGCHAKNPGNEKAVEEWLGKKIEIPTGLEPKILGRDTTVAIEQVFNKDYCVLTFMDSTGCTECKMQLHDWHLRVKDVHALANELNFVFIVHANNFAAVSAFAIKNKFNHLIFYDPNKRWWKANPRLPRRPELQTFLLNREHEVVLIGNPSTNNTLWELYKKRVTTEKI